MRNGSVSARWAGLDHVVNVDDVRALFARRLPVAVRDFIDGGGEDEITLRRNRSSFSDIEFRNRPLTDASRRSQSTTLLGLPVSSPIVLAPVGLSSLVHPLGELAAAMAAESAGIVSTLSSSSSWSLEDVADVTPDAMRWFQLYVWRDRSLTSDVIARARRNGYRALVVTVDVPVGGHRERDLRNGFTIPPRPTWRHAGDVLRHPRWVARFAWDEAFGHGLRMGNFGGRAAMNKRLAFMERVNARFDPGMTWDDLDTVKSEWGGPLVVKGITNAEAACKAVQHGADAVWVSNHGGRQLDGLPATVDVLPEVVDAVGDRVEVFVDGGIRRGSDAVKALALGARACMVGRPHVYGLAVGGQRGVEKVIRMLVDEIDTVLALLGCRSVGELDRTWLR